MDSVLLCCFAESALPEQKRLSKQIDKDIRREAKARRRQVKLLLLGAGESGKSTFLKQMRIIHNVNYDVTAQLAFRQIIYQNIVKGTKVLVDAQRKLAIPLSVSSHNYSNAPDDDIVALGDQLLLFDDFNGLDHRTFPPLQRMLDTLWREPAIQTAFRRRNEFQLSDSVEYFLNNLARIAREDYVPSLQDILYCRKTTKGVVEFSITIDTIPFLFVDVGGQRTQRQKWFQCFDSVTSILFIASSSEYDQTLLEDRRTNRLHESRNIFDTIVNNRIFINTSVILFLNKMDLLKEKIGRSDIGRHMTEFKNVEAVQSIAPGFQANSSDLDDVKKFLLWFFLSAKQQQHESDKPIYHHFTVAVDTNNISLVFRDVKDIILKKNLDALLLQ